jgi:cell division cycle 2-like
VPVLAGCRSVDVYEKLNKIDEGTYGVVYRARERETKRIVALKRLKIEKEQVRPPTVPDRHTQT